MNYLAGAGVAAGVTAGAAGAGAGVPPAMMSSTTWARLRAASWRPCTWPVSFWFASE